MKRLFCLFVLQLVGHQCGGSPEDDRHQHRPAHPDRGGRWRQPVRGQSGQTVRWRWVMWRTSRSTRPRGLDADRRVSLCFRERDAEEGGGSVVRPCVWSAFEQAEAAGQRASPSGDLLLWGSQLWRRGQRRVHPQTCAGDGRSPHSTVKPNTASPKNTKSVRVITKTRNTSGKTGNTNKQINDEGREDDDVTSEN